MVCEPSIPTGRKIGNMAFSQFTLGVILAVGLAACSTAPHVASADEKSSLSLQVISDHAHDQPRPYDASRDAKADVKGALEKAQANGKMTIVAMGANWCHDSRGFAAQFEKDRFKPLLKDHYELVYVDVGKLDRNIDIAQGFGVDAIVGTPTVFVVGTNGDVLNLDSAPSWRNAHSRTEDEVWDYFHGFTQTRP